MSGWGFPHSNPLADFKAEIEAARQRAFRVFHDVPHLVMTPAQYEAYSWYFRVTRINLDWQLALFPRSTRIRRRFWRRYRRIYWWWDDSRFLNELRWWWDMPLTNRINRIRRALSSRRVRSRPGRRPR